MNTAGGRRIRQWFFELTTRDQFRPSARGTDLEARRCELACPELNRFFYREVGRNCHWLDRLAWDETRWLEWLDRPQLETWLAYLAGTPVGYFELEVQDAGATVEIAYLGLLPRFIGRGLGGGLLGLAVDRAWALSPDRVWLHTCSLDHPRAIDNYRARGFELFDERIRP